jgi:hypothetical protein
LDRRAIAVNTLLVLTGMGVPPYSARGLSQTLEPIAASGDVRRTVNGTLRDLSMAQFRKYRSTITCQDQTAPAIDGVWPGKLLTVDCVAELSFPIGGAAERPVVPGSQRDEAGFTFYRPRLAMLVTGYSESIDEYGAAVGWQLALEEQ